MVVHRPLHAMPMWLWCCCDAMEIFSFIYFILFEWMWIVFTGFGFYILQLFCCVCFFRRLFRLIQAYALIAWFPFFFLSFLPLLFSYSKSFFFVLFCFVFLINTFRIQLFCRRRRSRRWHCFCHARAASRRYRNETASKRMLNEYIVCVFIMVSMVAVFFSTFSSELFFIFSLIILYVIISLGWRLASATSHIARH